MTSATTIDKMTTFQQLYEQAVREHRWVNVGWQQQENQ
jgi:hypothetical protein